jgi:hypothetical protein
LSQSLYHPYLWQGMPAALQSTAFIALVETMLIMPVKWVTIQIVSHHSFL